LQFTLHESCLCGTVHTLVWASYVLAGQFALLVPKMFLPYYDSSLIFLRTPNKAALSCTLKEAKMYLSLTPISFPYYVSENIAIKVNDFNLDTF
jgi:hypothetical protein